MWWGLGVLLALGLVLGRAEAADRLAQGRKSAAKANHLASLGKCSLAVKEFGTAYELLKDPVLLFNRAECLRKLGQDSAALEDYRKFLVDMPTAPNRASVEERVAALEAKRAEAPAAPSPEATAAPAKPAAAISPPALAKPVSPISPPALAKPVSPISPPALAKPVESPAVPPAKPVGVQTPKPAPVAAPTPKTAATPSQPLPPHAASALDDEQLMTFTATGDGAPAPQPARTGISPWVWIGVGVLAAGAATAAGVYFLDRSRTDVPATPLGNYRF